MTAPPFLNPGCRNGRPSPTVRTPAVATAAALLVAAAVAGIRPTPAPPICKPPPTLAARLINEPPPPTGTRGYDVLHYDLELQVNPAGRAISGTVKVALRAEAVLTEVQLDLVPELEIQATADATGPLPFTRDGALVTVALRTPLPAGDVDTLRISWSGQPPRHGSFAAGLMFRTHDPGTPTNPSDDVPVVANMSQPWSAHSWWPCKDDPADKARIRLAVTVPDTLTAVSNGTLVGSAPATPGWHRFVWRSDFLLPTYLVSLAVSNYVGWSEDCRPATGPSVRLDFHVFPEDSAAAAVDLAPSCAMMDFLTGLLTPWPYPGEKYAQVEFKWIGAMEHTTATSISQLALPGNRRFETLVLHEMIHQWFGDSLTPARWADIWLNEGFARYGEALWVEHRNGPDDYQAFMAEIGAVGNPDLFLGAGVLADPQPVLPNLLVYDKGAWVLHMLRRLVGDAAFFSFLAGYADDPTLVQGSVTTADMIAHAERAAGRSLAGFFGPWLETDLVPEISHEVAQPLPGTVRLTLRQHQEPLFEVPVPVLVYAGCGTTRLDVPLTRAVQTWTWDFDCPIDSVRIDPDSGALLRLVAAPPPPLVVRGPIPQPAGMAGAEFEFFLAQDALVIVSIYDLRGRKIAEESLGQLAATGSPSDAGPGHTWRWEPTAPGSPSLAAGLYFVAFEAAGDRAVRRAVLVR